MIKIDFTPPTDPKWDRWVLEAAKEHSVLLQLYAKSQPIVIKETLYKKRNKEFFDEVWTKCAYCESLMRITDIEDVEHFRPKGKVTDEDDNVVQIETPAGACAHPGYFWLAYDWRNLLPSCAWCNRPRRAPDGRLVGKSTRFPVFGKHALPPVGKGGKAELDAPKLLNPMIDDPSEHIDMDCPTGILFKKTERGEVCIKILDLNREGLPEARRQVFDNVILQAKAYRDALIEANHEKESRYEKLLMAHQLGRAEYSLAGRKALEIYAEARRRERTLFER